MAAEHADRLEIDAVEDVDQAVETGSRDDRYRVVVIVVQERPGEASDDFALGTAVAERVLFGVWTLSSIVRRRLESRDWLQRLAAELIGPIESHARAARRREDMA